MSSVVFERYFDLSPDLLVLADAAGICQRVNAAFLRGLGWAPAEVLGRPLLDLIHPDDQTLAQRELDRLTSGQPAAAFLGRWRTAGGADRHLLCSLVWEPEAGQCVAAGRDVTELAAAERRSRQIVEASPAALVLVDARGRIQLANQEAERLFGYRRDFLIGKPIELLVAADFRYEHHQHRSAYMQRPSPWLLGRGNQMEAMRRDGTAFMVEIGLSPVELADGLHVLASIVDLTHQKLAEERMIQLAADLDDANNRLSQLAVTDQLTGVFNRRAFDDQLEARFQLMRRMGRPLSLLMIDIDHFKHYNDRFGHLAGDEALRQVASLLRENARSTDVVARFGGEEFALLLPDTEAAGALQFAERLRQALRAHAWGLLPLTISIGVATSWSPAPGLDDPMTPNGGRLLAAADAALYHSKYHGRDQVTHINAMEPAPFSTEAEA